MFQVFKVNETTVDKGSKCGALKDYLISGVFSSELKSLIIKIIAILLL